MTPGPITRLESRLRKLLPANTLPRKIASQLRRRIKDPRVYSQIYREWSTPETPRGWKKILKAAFWLTVAIVMIVLYVLAAEYALSKGYPPPF